MLNDLTLKLKFIKDKTVLGKIIALLRNLLIGNKRFKEKMGANFFFQIREGLQMNFTEEDEELYD